MTPLVVVGACPAVFFACTFNGASGKPDVDGGIDVDAAIDGGDGGGMSVTCARPGAMRDSFAANQFKVAWDTSNNDMLTVDNEKLRLSGLLTVAAQTRYAVDLHNARFSFQLSELSPRMNYFGLTALDFKPEHVADTVVIEIDLSNNSNNLSVRIAGQESVSIQYDEIEHGLLSFHENDGQLTIEAKASISDPWVVLAGPVTSPAFVESAYFGFGFKGFGQHSVTIDELNFAAELANWCRLTDLGDNFDDIDPLVWRVIDDAGINSCAVVANAGVLVIHKPVAALLGRCLLVSAKAFDVTASSIAIEVDQINLMFNGAVLGLQLVDSNLYYAAIVVREESFDAPMICARVGQSPQTILESNCIPFMPNSRWKIRQLESSFEFTVLDNNGASVLSATMPVPTGMNVEELRVELGQTDALATGTGGSSIEISEISTSAP